jgi:hypothetical protein
LEERLRPEDTLIQLLLKPAPQAFVSDLQGTADIARILVHCRIPKRENIHLTVTPSRVGYLKSQLSALRTCLTAFIVFQILTRED